MISPYRVEYNSFSSLDFDLICDVAFDSDSGTTSSFLSREAVASETYRGAIKHVSSYKYTESFAPVITFVDKNFGDFTMERQRQILKWITSKDTPSFLNVYHDDSNVVSYAILGNFVSCDSYKIDNGRVVGFQCTFESVMPFALSDLYTVTKTISSATDNKITIEIDTDDNKPVYPRIIIKHGYNNTPHTVVSINQAFNSISDMADYVENTVYHNATTNTYYYKSYTPQFTSGTTLPQYVNWTTTEVNREYTSSDTFTANTFYHYEYEGMYYWKVGGTFYAEASRPVYGDWKTKAGTKVYTASDTFEDKTIYSYNGTYYWMAPYNFYKSSTPPNLQTTSVKLTNQHYDFFNQPSAPVVTIVKNNTGTEKIVLDGANKIVSSDRVRRVFGDDFNFQHLELYDGKNEITIEGNCEVTLEWREVRKIGEY